MVLDKKINQFFERWLNARFTLVYGFFPVITMFTDRFIPEKYGGYSYCVVNIIRPKYKNDKGLFYHELQHSKQFYRTFGLAPVLRWLRIFPFKSLKRIAYRKIFEYECEAYGKQLCYYTESRYRKELLRLFARFVVTKYGIKGYSQWQAEEEILNWYKRFQRKDG